MTSEQISLLNDGLERLEIYKNVIESIKSGKSEAESCARYGVEVNKFRRWIRDNYKSNTENKDYSDRNVYFNFADKVLHHVVGVREVYIHDDFNKSWEYVKSTLTEREALIVTLRYEQDLTLDEIATELNLSSGRIGSIVDKILRKLRHPSRLNVLLYGESYVKELKKMRREAEEKHQKCIQGKLEDVRGDLVSKYIALDSYASDLEEKHPIKYNEDGSINLDSVVIDYLDLTTKVYNALRRSGIKTVRDIIDYDRDKGIRRVRNIGKVGIKEIKDKILEVTGVDIEFKRYN